MADNVLPRSVQRLIDAFARLPGIGPKTASRLTFYLLRGSDDLILDLAEALSALRESTQLCSQCFNITEEDPCPVCDDPGRDETLICVVEEPLDVLAIERSRSFSGHYHVLHGAISPVEGIGPDNIRIDELVARLGRQPVSEIVIATNATLEGDATGLYLQRRLAGFDLRLTRLARGLPVGGDLEYTDAVTLGRAMDGRLEM